MTVSTAWPASSPGGCGKLFCHGHCPCLHVIARSRLPLLASCCLLSLSPALESPQRTGGQFCSGVRVSVLDLLMLLLVPHHSPKRHRASVPWCVRSPVVAGCPAVPPPSVCVCLPRSALFTTVLPGPGPRALEGPLSVSCPGCPAAVLPPESDEQ